MTCTRLDRYVVGLFLLMNLERFRERHLCRSLAHRHHLLLAMLAQKFRKLRLRYREVRSAQALPNFFVVPERSRVISAGLMTHQVLLTGLFPRFDSLCFLGVFHGLVSLFSVTVENNRENSKKKILEVQYLPMKMGL